MGAWLGCKPGRKDKINVVGLFSNRLEKLLRWWKATEQPLPDTAPLRSLAPPCDHSHGTADLAVYQINSYVACHCQSSTILHQCTTQSHMSLNSACCLILNPTNWTRNSRNLRRLSWSQYSSPHSNVHWLWLQANQRRTSEHTHWQPIPACFACKKPVSEPLTSPKTDKCNRSKWRMYQSMLPGECRCSHPSDLWSLKQKLDSSGQFRAGCVNQHCLGKKN